MKNSFIPLASILVCLGVLPLHAQPGPGPGRPGGPQLSGAISKLFGDNQTFSATMEMGVKDRAGQPITIPGKLSFDTGKSRFEVNIADMHGGRMPPDAAAQMKAMGMDVMITISRPDQKTAYLIYPGLQSYAQIQTPNAENALTNTDFKVEITEIGKDTLDGHSCVKNKYVVTDKEGVKHESTVWNATDLKKFPIKIQTSEHGDEVTMAFKDVSLTKPAASLFEPPSDFKKYDNIQQLMQQEMMKRMGGGMPGGMPGGMGHPPGGPPPDSTK
ncbi:MAG TPA: DUF4412 domain-containing protein [Candidatus Acidoferrum sp.]|nr:DUF4412 domain-containing protein [Candidatus Acidoferrum sp.]